VVNTTRGASAIRDSYSIRRQALQSGIPYFTTLSAALAGVAFMEATHDTGDDAPPKVRSLQEWNG
jgi:carbamoyl-phosphate synthase large subunit